MRKRTPHFITAAAALALLAGACTDAPTTAVPHALGERPSATVTGADGRLISTAVKYRDNGGKPATGRSGNAVMYALALANKQGVATVFIGASHATEWWRPGYITRAQIKASSADGKHRFTRNLNGYDDDAPDIMVPLNQFPNELHLPGLSPGDRLQVQANVAGLDGERTDVVTVTETVKRLPDLRVEMAAPAQVQARTAVNVLAVVSEANGDMGTYAACQLYVAGQLADQAAGVWVDAGDAVTCAMTWSFIAPGTYPVEVRIASNSGDWDTENNVASTSIQVKGDHPQLYTSASFRQMTVVDSSVSHQSWRDGASGLAGEYSVAWKQSSTDQYGNMYAWMSAQLPGTLTVSASMHTGAQRVDFRTFTQTSYGTETVCVDDFDGHILLGVCTYNFDGEGYTYVNYSYMAGSVTYHSREYSRIWDQLTGADLSVYHWNYDNEWVDGLVPLGDDWRYEVTLSAPGGEYVAAQTLRLEPQPTSEYVEPYTCRTFDDPFRAYTSTFCYTSLTRVETILGV